MSQSPHLPFIPLSCTAFAGHRRIASGPLAVVALTVRRAQTEATQDVILTFDDATGRVFDFDLRGSDDEIAARFSPLPAEPLDKEEETGEMRGRGRPKLGVVAREVTLLPHHWDWLSTQPGGASVALRKLVEEARRSNEIADRTRKSRDAAYAFMSAMAGDFSGFEEASRALFAHDRPRFESLITGWPEDVRGYIVQLAFTEHI